MGDLHVRLQFFLAEFLVDVPDFESLDLLGMEREVDWVSGILRAAGGLLYSPVVYPELRGFEE